jgi:energy-converting hydrogenase B subunit D
MEVVVLIVVIVMLLSAVAVMLFKDFLAALAAMTVVSLGLSFLFVVVRAPDVAMTEAAIGAGLSSLLFALALRRLGLWRSQ